jgi:hypothetical protein
MSSRTCVLRQLTYRSFATRVSQLQIWHFWVIGIERNVCRCTFNRYSVITQFAKLAAGSSCVFVALIENHGTSKALKFSLKKSHILSCDIVVANERCVLNKYYMLLLIRRFLGASAVAKSNYSINKFCLSVRLSVRVEQFGSHRINSSNAELNPICHLLALLGAHQIFHVSGLRVNCCEIWY